MISLLSVFFTWRTNSSYLNCVIQTLILTEMPYRMKIIDIYKNTFYFYNRSENETDFPIGMRIIISRNIFLFVMRFLSQKGCSCGSFPYRKEDVFQRKASVPAGFPWWNGWFSFTNFPCRKINDNFQQKLDFANNSSVLASFLSMKWMPF